MIPWQRVDVQKRLVLGGRVAVGRGDNRRAPQNENCCEAKVPRSVETQSEVANEHPQRGRPLFLVRAEGLRCDSLGWRESDERRPR